MYSKNKTNINNIAVTAEYNVVIAHKPGLKHVGINWFHGLIKCKDR